MGLPFIYHPWFGFNLLPSNEARTAYSWSNGCSRSGIFYPNVANQGTVQF